MVQYSVNHGIEDPMKRYLLGSLLLLITFFAVAASAASLPFIQDDFPKARAQANAHQLPIFVECWAPW